MHLFWWKNNNFGDRLSPELIKKIFGSVTYSNPDEPCFFAIGSILQNCKNNDSTIWGSGFISSKSKLSCKPKILAVRGKLTRQKIINQGMYCPKSYGDPALLIPLYFKTYPKEYDLAIIPHYTDLDHELIKRPPENTKIISPYLSPKEFIKEVSRSKKIISSSLHGIISGHSLQIPTAHITLNQKLIGGNFKFQDYYSSVNLPHYPIPYTKETKLNQLPYSTPKLKIITKLQNNLIDKVNQIKLNKHF